VVIAHSSKVSRLLPSASSAVSIRRGPSCLTNNAAERALRCIPLGRKAWLFCGSDRGGQRAAIIYTLLQTAKLNDVDPQAGSPMSSPASPINRNRPIVTAD
jgi:hypothetical protein